MDTVEFFYDFLRKIWAPNFLAIGIAVIVMWLLVSGVRRGLKKGGREEPPKNNNEQHSEE